MRVVDVDVPSSSCVLFSAFLVGVPVDGFHSHVLLFFHPRQVEPGTPARQCVQPVHAALHRVSVQHSSVCVDGHGDVGAPVHRTR